MKEEIERKMEEDASSIADTFSVPVFLDSATLTDLSCLKQHVQGSHNLILLLTNGLLSRSWCLLEIVAAVQANVQIVPVEIQRPGVVFSYPDERFFDDLSRGKVLSKDDLSLFESEGVELSSLTSAVRQAFQKIALPYSPHKSASIRQAEIADILARCLRRECSIRETV